MRSITLQNFEVNSPVVAEEFRKIQTSLDFSLPDKHILCITSSLPNEGKSYVSIQLAKTIAESGHRVFLVDADLRNSTMSKKFGYPQEMEGLSHVLTGKLSLDECAYETNIDNFFLIPTGNFSNNSTKLFRSSRLPALLDAISEVVDYVIIDTPPISMVTDAEIIANMASGTVLVVGSNMVHRSLVKKSIERLNISTENFLGVILNKADAKGGKYGRYGKYGKYGKYGNYGSYGYGYGYYGKDVKK